MACLTTGDMIFRGVLIFILILLMIFLGFNIFEFNKIRQNPGTVSKNTAIAMMVVSAIFIFIAFLLLIWIVVSWFWCDPVIPPVFTTRTVVPQEIEMGEFPRSVVTQQMVPQQMVPQQMVTQQMVPTGDIRVVSYPTGTGVPVSSMYPTGTGVPVSSIYPTGTGVPVSSMYPQVTSVSAYPQQVKYVYNK